jgi:molecular chaperone DnaK
MQNRAVAKTSAEIDLGDINLTDDDGVAIDTLLTVTRSEFEEVIKDAIDGTAEMMRKILTRNSLQARDLKFVLMVGGSTYIPFVRKRIEELMGIPANTLIDPTNAVVVGAAHFAGTKEFRIGATEKKPASNNSSRRFRPVYNRNSQEAEETFTAKVEGDLSGLFYRIIGEDGAYDSGLKALTRRINEDLPLREGAFNLFTFRILDAQNNVIDVGFDSIQIAQGRYSVAGQMLPEDISLVKDDLARKDTMLDLLFTKNSVLPASGKKTVEVAKTIVKGSGDNIKLVVVEGPSTRHSTTNKPIGILEISGEKLSKDLLRGTEIDLTVEMSESRDLTVSAYLNGTGQGFSQVFKGSERTVNPGLLAAEVVQLETSILNEIDEAEANDNYETADKLKRLQGETMGLITECTALAEDDVTDDRFKLEDKKRRTAQDVFELTSTKRVDAARTAYFEGKKQTTAIVQDHGNDRDKHHLHEIVAVEPTFIESTNFLRIEEFTNRLDRLRYQILRRVPDFLIDMFKYLNEDRRPSMNDQVQAKQLFENGKRLIAEQSWDELNQVIARLWDLVPAEESSTDEEARMFTGII